ncbi:Ig-like domain-containing protein [Pseudomonas stutzeri]|nr:Ig-like domain-containing protein [Stutzerimonas stutzeri]
MKSASGVKVTVPSALSTALPPVPLVTLVPPVPLVTLAMLRLSPSTSLSLPSRSAAAKVTGVSSVAARLSSLASGASFTGVTVRVRVDYTVTDGSLTDTATLTLTVTPVNDAPVAQNDAVTVSEDVPFSSSISLLANDSDVDGDTSISLLANDSDVDGDSLSVVAGTFVTAQGGSIVIAADGSYTYTPPADFHGTDTVDYTVMTV